jgi:hypothetical protein
MKKIRVTGLMIGLIILLTVSAKAQYFYTSYGYAHTWQLPNYIEHTIYNDYYGYEVAHVERRVHHGYTNFDVLLTRGNLFLEVRFDRFGHVYRTARYDYFPLAAHNCSMHCGYHKVYYQTYYPQHHHNYYNPYSTTVYVTKTEPYHHNHTYVNNHYTKVYVQPNGGNNNGNHNRQNTNYNNGGNNVNVQHRTKGPIHQPTVVNNNSGNRSTAPVVRNERTEQPKPRVVTENRSNNNPAGRTTSERGYSGRGNK